MKPTSLMALLFAVVLSACQGDTDDLSVVDGDCEPGHTARCLCDDGRQGTQICLTERIYSVCSCYFGQGGRPDAGFSPPSRRDAGSPTPPPPPPPPPPPFDAGFVDAGPIRGTGPTFAAAAMAMDPVRGILYVTVPTSDREYGNELVALDPRTETIQWSTFVGSDPGPLTLTPDGTKVYIGLRGAPRVVRVDTASRAVDLDFDVGQDEFFGPLYAGDLAPVAGSPNTIVVSTRRLGVSPDFGGVFMYDDGISRETHTRDHTGARMIEAFDATRIYGFNNSSTEFGFRELQITSDGISEIWVVRDLFGNFSTDFRIIGQRGYTTGGQIIDPPNRTIIGSLDAAGPVTATVDGSRVWIIGGDRFGAENRLIAFDGNVLRRIGEREVEDVVEPVQLERFGADGFVILSQRDRWDPGSGELLFVRAPALVN